MPEYLTPGVYVEETSFRPKSIEGVSTSTTAFVGPTRRGPIDGTPELLTSFADFERIYGGLGALTFAGDEPNYLAHSVRAYFDNGGARLYVSRAYTLAAGADPGADLSPGHASWSNGNGPQRLALVARRPGSGGNGRLEAQLSTRPVSGRTLETAPEGSLARTGGKPGRPAALDGGATPLPVDPDRVLALTVGPAGATADVSITFSGTAAELTAPDPVQTPLAAGTELELELDGRPTRLTLPPRQDGNPYTVLGEIAEALDARLTGGRIRADGGKLTVSSGTKGSASRVLVKRMDELGFTGDPSQTVEGAGSVPDLGAVTAADVEQLLAAAGGAVRAVEFFDGGVARLRLVSRDVGESVRLVVDAANGDAQTSLGLSANSATGRAGGQVTYYEKRGRAWKREGGGVDLDLANLPEEVDLLTMNLTIADADGVETVHGEVGFGASHPRSLGAVLAATPARRREDLEHPIRADIGHEVDAFVLRERLFGSGVEFAATLTGGNDGLRPGVEPYRAALERLRSVEGISIVAGPGSSAHDEPATRNGVRNLLVEHVSKRRAYQIAVLDTPEGQVVSEASAERSSIDSKYAAMYYPWVVVPNPLARPGDLSQPAEIELPPSGFICGIYARNDVQRGVYKAPANEVVRGALRFETDINFDEQAVLNPAGVNCLRFFPGRGHRVWGARLASSDPEWKYVSDRRYFNYLEASIDRGTQWAVFEPNGERLWTNVRDTVASFLYNEWKNGYLLGASEQAAYFVRCDRSTMTQNDLDNGRLVCLVGVAIIRPAEFVIFRIGQKTADARS